MADITGTATLDGAALANAKITAINDTQGVVEATTTTAADGTYTLTVTGGDTYHVLFEYDDGAGTQYQDHSQPFVAVESSAPAFWSESLHRYQFTEGSGTTVADSGSAATLSDLTLNGPSWTTDAIHEGWATSYDGTDDYATASSQSTMSGYTSGMTCLLWAKIENQTGRLGIVGVYDSNNADRSWIFEQNSQNELRVFYSADGTNYTNSGWSSFSSYGQWIRFAIRWESGQSFAMFMDGTEVSPSWSGSTVAELYQSSAPLDIARSTLSSAFLAGQVDDLHLYDRALTDQEIQDDYNAYEVP